MRKLILIILTCGLVAACDTDIPAPPRITVVITAIENNAALEEAVADALTETQQFSLPITQTAIAVQGVTLTATYTPTSTATPLPPTATRFMTATATATPTASSTPTYLPFPTNTPLPAPAGQSSTATPEPSLTASQDTAVRGDTITLSGSGFSADTAYEIRIGTDVAAEGTMDAAGQFEAEFTVPEDVSGDVLDISVCTQCDSDNQQTAALQLRLETSEGSGT